MILGIYVMICWSGTSRARAHVCTLNFIAL